MIEEVETRPLGAAGLAEECSLRGSENGPPIARNPTSKQVRLACARRDLRIARAKLAAIAAWRHREPLAELDVVVPALLGEIVQQLWRASATLAAEARR
jgi:hypothetical protein